MFVVFAALVLARVMSEGVYDIAFANLALDLSGLVSTVGLVYCVGYGAEVVASIAASPLLDRRSPQAVLIGSYLVKVGVFGLIGFGSTFLSSHLWAIVAAAASVDLVHHVGEMALFVLLPRILDSKTLVRVQGIGGTVRSAGELLSPVVAGLALAALPGSRALLLAAGLQIIALLFFAVLITVVNNNPAARRVDAPDESGSVKVSQAPNAPLPTRRLVARTLSRNRAWRRFIIFHALTTLALSTVILSILPFMREALGMSAAAAGSFLVFSTVGALIGGLVVAKAGPGGIYANIRWAPVLAGFGTLTATLLGRSPWLLATGLIMFGLGFTVYLKSAGLLVQLRAPSTVLGTWHGLIDAVIRIVSAAAILATGFLFDQIGGRVIYFSLSLILLFAAALWSTLRQDFRSDLSATPLHPASADESACGGM